MGRFYRKLARPAVIGFFIANAFAFNLAAEPLEVSADKELLWDQTQGLYQAVGNAVAQRGAQRITADTLKAFYNSQNQTQDIERILAISNVKFSDTNLSGAGAELDYSLGENLYRLAGPGAKINSKDGDASADQELVFHRNEGRLRLIGNAVISLDDGRILKGQKLFISLDENEEIETVEAKGDVFISQSAGKEARADEGTYDAKSGKSILTGNVKIKDGDSILNGQKAEIDFNSGISRLLASDGGGRVSGILVEAE